MKKKTILLSALMFSIMTFSQVGINTETPQATLDIVGKPTDINTLDGIIAPRISGEQLRAKTYTANQRGALVYVTEADTAPAGQTIDVTATGYYYFNGTKWIPSDGHNIYNSNGTLTGNRVLTTSNYSLSFNNNSLQRTIWNPTTGGLNQEGLSTSPTKHGSISVRAADNDSNGITSNLHLQIYPENYAQIVADGDAAGLSLTTNATTDSAPIRFSTSAGGGALGNEKMRITGTGNVGIGTVNPTEKFHLNGIARLQGLPLNGATNAIFTTPGGSLSSSQDQTFTATRTVVADANGVLGYVNGLPGTGSGTPPSGSINIGETISAIYSVPTTVANLNTFNLKTYVTANSLQALPVIDGLEINLQGVNGAYYDPRIYNVSSTTKLVSYQTFATQVNENKTSLNNSLTPGDYLRVDINNLVFWSTSAAEVETTNLQVQIDANTYRWYEFKWWCMEVSGEKKIFLSVTRKA